MKTIWFFAFMGVLFFIGIVCLLYPEKVQEIAIRSVSQGFLTQNSLLESFIKSSKYLAVVKAVGILATLMFCFLIWAFFQTK